MEEVNVRFANIEDKKDLATLISEDYVTQIGEEFKIEDVLYMLNMELSKDHINYFVAEKNNEIIGYVKCVEKGNDCHGESIYVKHGFRGQGVGFELHKTMTDAARSNGFLRYLTQVKEDNVASIKIHDKLNFTIDKIEDKVMYLSLNLQQDFVYQ